jgi:hypothetical protein
MAQGMTEMWSQKGRNLQVSLHQGISWEDEQLPTADGRMRAVCYTLYEYV